MARARTAVPPLPSARRQVNECKEPVQAFFLYYVPSCLCKTPGGEKERKMKGQDAHDAHLRMIMKKQAPETGAQVQAGHSWHESPPRGRDHFAHHTACHE